VIVGIRNQQHAVGAGGHEAILPIPHEGPYAVREHIAVRVVGRRVHRPSSDVGVLVQRVGGVDVRRDVGRRGQPVTVAAASRDAAPRSALSHGLKIAIALRLRLGLGALLITDRVVDIAVAVRSHSRFRHLRALIIAERVGDFHRDARGVQNLRTGRAPSENSSDEATADPEQEDQWQPPPVNGAKT